jgi:hypothetical protein
MTYAIETRAQSSSYKNNENEDFKVHHWCNIE